MRELRQSYACSCGTEELRSKLDGEALELFMAADAGVSELLLPVCDQLGEDDLAAALGRLAERPEQLSVVQLGFCGHASRRPSRRCSTRACRNLHTLRLAGCLSTAALMALCEARREGLQLSGNSQLAAPGLAALGAHCGRRARGSRFLSSAQPASLFLKSC